jgi:hypothetical protein
MNRTLVVDIGGTHVKLLMEGAEHRQLDSGPEMRPADFVARLKETTRGWDFDQISIGFPSVVRADNVMKEPKHLGPGWAGFDFAQSGLGTGLGSALVLAKMLPPSISLRLPSSKPGKLCPDYADASFSETFFTTISEQSDLTLSMSARFSARCHRDYGKLMRSVSCDCYDRRACSPVSFFTAQNRTRPFPIDDSTTREIFGRRFALIKNEPVADSLPIFAGRKNGGLAASRER